MRRQFGWSQLMVLVAILLVAAVAVAQTTISTGSISGTVTDQSGAVVPGAKVTITNNATAQATTSTTSSTGLYGSGALIPGVYTVKVEKSGFQTQQVTLNVRVGVTSNGDTSLKPGAENQVINVEASTLQVNTQQATVQGVLTAQQIETMPVGGRNFLDLAQLEPGVQIQEGSTFDPTKNGYSSISFGGRFGRTARIEVDGLDVSDETVGTTTTNIPESAIQEFQLAQSSLDPSSELTSSGEVNVVTRSGENTLHGQAYYDIRDSRIAAVLPGPPAPFQRNQFGGRLGGTFIKDKLFWFISGERTKQDLSLPEVFTGTFAPLSGTFQSPFRETMADGRLDWNISNNWRMFYRFSYDQNASTRGFGSAASFQPFKNRDFVPSHAVGLDGTTGSWTHSIRFGYLKFRNGIVDGEGVLTPAQNPFPGLSVSVGSPFPSNCVLTGCAFGTGPNLLAPQATIQSNHQYKYDGSKIKGNHIFRYGFAWNHIQGGGFATFFQFPTVGTPTVITGDTNLGDYPVDNVILGSGVGFSTELPSFGFPAGGLGPDNRIEWYFGDNWKLTPRFTLTYALRYVRDSGRVDADVPPIAALAAFTPDPKLGNRVRNPNANFAPQIGFAWDVTGSGRTVIRAGGGLFYDNSIFNNVLFDRPARLQTGSFLTTPLACGFGSGFPITWPVSTSSIGPTGTVFASGGATVTGPSSVTANFCGQPLSAVSAQIQALSDAYHAANAGVGAGPNSSFIGSNMAAGPIFNGLSLIGPNYRTPRSWQMNIGVQHEIAPGTILTVDYIRNVGLHFLLGIDANHVGDVRNYNQANAIAARDAAQAAAGCGAGPGQAACVVTALGQAGAQALYSGEGFDSGDQGPSFGGPCPTCAFPGLDPAWGQLSFLQPIGRSVYNGLDVSLKHDSAHFFVPGVKHANYQISYSLSRFVSQVQDQDFVNTATDQNNPLRFTGPNALDRKHQISFGGTFDLPWYTRISLVGHIYSPLSQSLFLPQVQSGGEIFVTDVTGDGTTGDVVPGTNIGSFQRQFGISGLPGVINNYNSANAGQLTPAGQAVVGSGVMTLADMQALGWVQQPLASVASGAKGLTWFRDFDLKLAWPIKIGERISLEPQVSFYNVFNIANEFLGGNLPLGVLLPGGSGCANCLADNVIGGVTGAKSSIDPFRATMQSGTNAFGAPRQIEFGLRLTF